MTINILSFYFIGGHMKQDSLLSARSNLSQLSNVSYQGQKKQYIGSEFFRESLPPGYYHRLPFVQLKQEQIQLQSLIRNFPPVKDYFSAFTPYWASELHQNIQGTSDNEDNAGDEPIVKKQQQYEKMAKIQWINQYISEFNTSLVKKQHVFKNQEAEKISIKNETKNIPKNYGKAIIIFIQNNRLIIENILTQNGDNYESLVSKLKKFKQKINTILDLRIMWQQFPESKSLRMISNLFLRKHSLHYIYNSRIKTRMCHSKYKRRLQQALVKPQQFHHIKDY